MRIILALVFLGMSCGLNASVSPAYQMLLNRQDVEWVRQNRTCNLRWNQYCNAQRKRKNRTLTSLASDHFEREYLYSHLKRLAARHREEQKRFLDAEYEAEYEAEQRAESEQKERVTLQQEVAQQRQQIQALSSELAQLKIVHPEKTDTKQLSMTQQSNVQALQSQNSVASSSQAQQ